MGIEKLNNLFNPKRVAVIGASDREGSIGAKILRNLIEAGFKGAVFPVNPFRDKVQGITAYPSISKIPDKIDLAVIATPAHTVPQIVEECGEAGVSGIIICSAGFREVGKEGFDIEKRILECQMKYGIRIIGPKSFGVIRPKINLYATFAYERATPGKIALISQSGSLCASALDWASESQIGFSAIVSTGSMLDVDLGDLIDFFGVDPQTRSIVIYVESIANVRKFMSAARGFARSKPIILVKAGRFQESKPFTLSHGGGELISLDAIHDAAFRRVGVVRVENITDLLNCAEALSLQPKPSGPNLTIITNAGGPALMATDHLIARGGKLSHLTENSCQALKEALPYYCNAVNPLDVFEDATPTRFRKAIEICHKDPNSDGTLIVYAPQEITNASIFAQIVAETAKHTTKTLLVALTGESTLCREARKLLQKNSIPAFRMPEEAVSTFMYMWTYNQNLELLYQTPEPSPTDRFVTTHLKEILRRNCREGCKVLTLPDSMRFLEAYKIPTVKTYVAKTPQEALALSSELGFPVVMKALSPQFTHKSEIDGVVLNVCSPSQVETHFNDLKDRVKKSASPAEFEGIAIQRMLTKRIYEIFLASKREARFGSIILFGMGGTSVELLKDVSLGFPPLNRVLARRLMENTAIYKHLLANGKRFKSESLEEILVNFSQLVTDFPEIEAVDINPIIIDDNGVNAVDARITIDTSRIMREVAEHERPHLVIAPYPIKYIATRRLKDETPVLFRPMKPEDEGLFNELFKSLSNETKRFRFFEIIKEMSHETLTRYCNLDYDREVAIVAQLQSNDKKLLGVSRLIVEPDGKNGEFAVLVGDKWQGMGLGAKLLDSIIAVGKDMHLERIFGMIMQTNYKMINLCSKKGFESIILDEETVEMSLKLL
jgi:acetyltransferase